MTAAVTTHRTHRFEAHWLMEVLTLAALYFLTARLGLLMAIPGGHITPVWPPSGIALAAVLLRGRRVWPGIWLGSFAANLWDFYGSPASLATELATSATFGIGASLTALLGSQLLRRFVGERNPLERVRDVCAFMALGGVVSCLVSATVGVTTLCLAGFAPWSSYGQAWLTWWLGDTAGVFIVAPLLLVWGDTRLPKAAMRWVELLGGFGLLIAVTYYVFIETTTVLFPGKSLAFILIPFLVWSAVRFGRRGAATAAGLIALLAVWGTIHGSGPFNLGSRNESLLALELFLSVISLTALCIAAVVTERRRVLDELESRVAERTASLDQANAALRESEARTRILIKSSNIGLWDWNLVTNEVFFSPEWKSQLGYADAEVPGRYEEWESRLHPEDREPSLRAVQDFREGRREDYDVEFRLRHKNGSWRSILARADLIRDAAGQPVGMMGCHIDITERKHAEIASIRLAAIVESSDDAIIGIDLNDIITSWNRGAEKIFGYEAGEIVGNPITRLIPPDRQEEERHVLSRIKQGARVEHFETVRIGQSGRPIDISLTISPIKNTAGDVVGASRVARDITERKTIEQALEKAEEQYRSIFDNAVDGIFRTSPDGKFLVTNPAAARIFGFVSPEELIEERRDIARQGYVDPDRREEFKRLIQEQGIVNGFEYEGYRKDGSRVWISENTRAVHSPSGEILYFEGVFEDVTDRKRAETALQMMRFCVDHAGDGVFWVSPEGRLLYVNESTCKRLGYSESELLGLKIFDLDPDYQPGVWATHWEELKRRRTITLETRHRTKAGRVFPIEVNANYVCVGGHEFNFAFTRDITDRKEAEEALNAQALRYKTLMETSTDSISVLDEKGDLQEANAAFLLRRGYTAAEVKGLSVADWDARWTREQLQARLRKLADGGAVFETRHRCKDGSIFDVEVCATSVRIGGEQLFFCVTRDITERKKAEFALRQLAQVSAASSDYIALIGRDFRYQFVNDIYLKVRGLHLEAIIGHHMKEIVGQEEFEQFGRPQVEACLRGEEVEAFEWIDFRSDLRGFLHVKAAPLREPDGTISGAVMSGRDITARYEAEQAQRESEERFRQLAENIDDIFWLTDLQHKKVLYISPAYEKIWGRTCESLYASTRSWTDSLHPEDRERILALRGDDHLQEMPDMTYRIVRPDGSLRWIHQREFPVKDADGKVVRVAGIVEDITERKLVEQSQRESQLRYEALVQSIDGIVWEADPQTFTFTFVSKQAERILGYPLEQWFEGPSFWPDHMHPADRDWAVKFCVDATARGENHQFEYRMISADGREVWLNDIVTLHTAPDQSLILRGLMVDITERKQADQALRETETRFRQIAENIDEIFWITDLKGSSTIYISPAYERIMGKSCESLYAEPKSWRDDIHPEDRPRMEATFASDPGSTGDYTYRIVRPDGSIRWIRDRGFPVRGESGKLIRFAGIAEDITEYKIAEAALRDSEERFRELAENINEVFFVWDATEGASRLLYVSPAYATIWGHSCESLYSSHQSWKEALHPDDRKWVLAELSNSALEKITDLSYRIVRPDQSVRWIRDRIFPVHDENGVVVRLAEINVDITENKLAEEELRQVNEQRRDLSRRLFQVQDDERRHLARELHDEIGQALTAAKINVDSIESAERSTQSLRLKETSTLLDNLLRQVRQISLDLHSSLLDDLGLAPALRSLLDQQARRAGLRAQFFAPEPLENIDPEIQTTGFRIAQEAITNVLRHAKAQSIGVHLQTDSGRLQMKIVDDGRGFDLAEVEHRAHQEASFGLMGMRERAALVGGRVQIISSPNKGTTVEVSLPLHASGDIPQFLA